ncbi:MAG: hypothetical protein IT366_04160 [Candidatus Hydrogenedentes bacterium]|nr:hypothetical protein [Candidatus Hydrogenedentota bacterium]
MDKPLSQETQSQIRTLCESIAQRDQLGVDAQEELCGHIEDKVIAFLDGKEALSEADALLLAIEHFGHRPTQSPFDRELSMPRSIAALAVFTLFSGAIAKSTCLIAGLPFSLLLNPKDLWIASIAASAFYNVTTCVLVFLFLLHGRKDGRLNVLQRLELARTWQVIVFVVGLAVFTWSLLPSLVWEWYDRNTVSAFALSAHAIGLYIIRGSTAVTMCVFWMVWCGSNQNYARTAIVAIAWAVMLIVHGVFLKLIGATALVVAGNELRQNTSLFESASGLHMSFSGLSPAHVQFIPVITVVAITACFSYVLYSVVRILHQRIPRLA